MQKLTTEGQNLVNDLSYRYNLSQDAVIHMIGAVINGGGSMAQFNSPELGGGGQWMQGGMTMVGDMFNSGLKNTVNNLCAEISNSLNSVQIFPLAPVGTPQSSQWWGLDLGMPSSSGGQNNTRYAVFPQRLAVEINGQVTIYDTLDNNIGGVSQQQGGDNSMTFSSQYGTILVSSLPIVSGTPRPPKPIENNNFAQPMPQQPTPEFIPTPTPVVETPKANNSNNNTNNNSLFEMIEKLSQLHEVGALTSSEYENKKSELLSRI